MLIWTSLKSYDYKTLIIINKLKPKNPSRSINLFKIFLEKGTSCILDNRILDANILLTLLQLIFIFPIETRIIIKIFYFYEENREIVLTKCVTMIFI